MRHRNHRVGASLAAMLTVLCAACTPIFVGNRHPVPFRVRLQLPGSSQPKVRTLRAGGHFTEFPPLGGRVTVELMADLDRESLEKRRTDLTMAVFGLGTGPGEPDHALLELQEVNQALTAPIGVIDSYSATVPDFGKMACEVDIDVDWDIQGDSPYAEARLLCDVEEPTIELMELIGG